jgi:uncharacterized protein (DUF952 family)
MQVFELEEFSQHTDPEHIFKLCTAVQWQALQASGSSFGSADDLRDGYIHLSMREQVFGTFEKYFAAEHACGEVIWLLHCALSGLPPEHLKFEASRAGMLFPHFYGALPLTSIVSAQQII